MHGAYPGDHAASRRAANVLVAVVARIVFVLAALAPPGATAEFESAVVPLRETSGSTLYVSVEIGGLGAQDYLVDTGAGYTSIDEKSLDVLRHNQNVVFVKRLEGTLADGSTMIVPVYRLPQLSIGGVCTVDEVEVAVFPGSVRGILGLNVLRRAAPFTLSIEPPALRLAGCNARTGTIDSTLQHGAASWPDSVTRVR